MKPKPKPKAKFKVGQVVVDSSIVPSVLGKILRNRKTGQYGVVCWYRQADAKIYTDLENFRPLTKREAGQKEERP